mgnify:CR=1 FL=1
MKRSTVTLPNYMIGADVFDKAGAVLKKYGKKAVIVGGKKAMAAAAITAAGLSVLVNIFFYYSGIECRARESIQGLCDALCRHSYVKLRQTIKEKGVDECGELWPSG